MYCTVLYLAHEDVGALAGLGEVRRPRRVVHRVPHHLLDRRHNLGRGMRRERAALNEWLIPNQQFCHLVNTVNFFSS
jgi:hypothetical protein